MGPFVGIGSYPPPLPRHLSQLECLLLHYYYHLLLVALLCLWLVSWRGFGGGGWSQLQRRCHERGFRSIRTVVLILRFEGYFFSPMQFCQTQSKYFLSWSRMSSIHVCSYSQFMNSVISGTYLLALAIDRSNFKLFSFFIEWFLVDPILGNSFSVVIENVLWRVWTS